MENILTLIAGPKVGLTDAMVADIRQGLKALGAHVAAAQWLSPGKACDLAFGDLAPEQADAAARQRLGKVAVDVVAQAAQGRRKLLLVADMDSTMVVGETLDELAEYAGIKDRISAITARAMNGEIGFEAALKERIGLMAGVPETALAETWAKTRLMPGARTLVQTMKANGAYAVLVSGGFTYFTTRVREACGFDIDLGNRFIFTDGKLSGVEDPILGRETKLATLIGTAGERKIPLALAAAVGDGANDLDMIKAAGLGVAYQAKPVVAAEARVRIDHGDLTALLYAQGYGDDDMVEG
ncbi:Phosphoserine phosphatase (PSP) [Magnetospirillum gryphiswaldense MSR-1 v2]|uniref:Phosphoserine phosphatase n=1 Tax=Magnetospirillum gryphiswaldense (strain DSM 6361 / JCM 21280 / NBRC 15271 / MSR-1) TaxID=431944 RepID=V6EWK9_MAGGM|nr:phosphoserine phosphatase SerB [Magnetospirillum gryphiswaldense]CDK97660.1 Phosphoserine phosphatase (PSP) [Magnetospirillum gryphiswaldense MSR-1 v2]